MPYLVGGGATAAEALQGGVSKKNAGQLIGNFVIGGLLGIAGGNAVGDVRETVGVSLTTNEAVQTIIDYLTVPTIIYGSQYIKATKIGTSAERAAKKQAKLGENAREWVNVKISLKEKGVSQDEMQKRVANLERLERDIHNLAGSDERFQAIKQELNQMEQQAKQELKEQARELDRMAS